MKQLKAKRTLHARYVHDNRDADGERLSALLRESGNEFVPFHDNTAWDFLIQKTSGQTWEDVMRLVNSVHAVKYRFESHIIHNGQAYIDCVVVRV